MIRPSSGLVSVVSPVYQAGDIVPKLVIGIKEAMENVSCKYEIILVEDGSSDHSWESIVSECVRDRNIKGIKLSRNFGQHNAITAGLKIAQGVWVIVMDCDLQDRPDQIQALLDKASEGFEIVFARRNKRKDGFLKRRTSAIFYKIFGYLTRTKQDGAVANFGVYHHKVIQAILSMSDQIRYFPTMSQWVGFRKTYLDVEHGPGEFRKSSYTWSSLFSLAINNIIAFSDRPLKLTVQFGLVMSTVSAIVGIYYFISYLTGVITVSGFTSLIISIWFLSGIIIFILGVIGLYLAKTFEKVKGRPLYIIDQQLNLE